MVGVLPSQGALPIPVGKIPDGATQILTFKDTDNTTEDVYRVTVGPVFYLCAITTGVWNASGAARVVFVRICDDGDVVKYLITYTQVAANGFYTLPTTFWPPLEMPVGWYIEQSSPALNCVLVTSIFGYEI